MPCAEQAGRQAWLVLLHFNKVRHPRWHAEQIKLTSTKLCIHTVHTCRYRHTGDIYAQQTCPTCIHAYMHAYMHAYIEDVAKINTPWPWPWPWYTYTAAFIPWEDVAKINTPWPWPWPWWVVHSKWYAKCKKCYGLPGSSLMLLLGPTWPNPDLCSCSLRFRFYIHAALQGSSEACEQKPSSSAAYRQTPVEPSWCAGGWGRFHCLTRPCCIICVLCLLCVGGSFSVIRGPHHSWMHSWL